MLAAVFRRFCLTALATACTSAPPAAPPEPARALSIVGTNDLHGRLESLPILGGHLENLRAERPVLLVDAGDMFQGTLESNLTEGAIVIDAYAALGYAAAAVGNHELDFGTEALQRRIRESPFPLLSANLIEKRSRKPVAWDELRASALADVGGVRVGIVGVLTEETPEIVMPALFEGLDVAPIVTSVEREARELRARGAELIVLLAHAGGSCKRFDAPADVSSCKADAEIMRIARELGPQTVDAIVAGHTHQGMAHFVGGVPVVEAYAYGRAFSRIDVQFGPRGPELAVHPPHDLCPEGQSFADCTPGEYAGAPVARDLGVARVIAPALQRAEKKRDQPLGVQVVAPITESFSEPSALGNLFADLLRESVPGADAAIMNGGGVRAPFPAGPLTYGALHEAMPFDNTLAVVRLTGRELAAVLAAHLSSDRHGILSISGVGARARCDGDHLAIELRRPDGSAIADSDELAIVVSDYLATGGDELFAPARLSPDRVKLLPELLRDALAKRLSARGGSLDGTSFLDPEHPRLAFPGKRPVRCP